MTKDHDVDLSPCPFCPNGGNPYFTRAVNGTKMIHVGCSQCGVQLKAALIMVTPVDEQPSKDIVTIWSTRSPSWGEWQPISSAPKDGTAILAYPVFGEVKVVTWWRSNIHREGGSFINGNMAVRPTYFIPLPPPPAEKGDDEHS